MTHKSHTALQAAPTAPHPGPHREITVAWLRQRNACGEQVSIVEKEWGGAPIPLTREHLQRAAALRLDLSWLADQLGLGAEAQRIYDEATAEAQRIYDEARAGAWRIYYEARAEALYLALGGDAR